MTEQRVPEIDTVCFEEMFADILAEEQKIPIVVAQDGGTKGALAAMPLTAERKVILMRRLPYYKIKRGSGNRSILDAREFAGMFKDLQTKYKIMAIGAEELHPVKTFGAITNFNFGVSNCSIEMVAATLGIPFFWVRSKEWQSFEFPHRGGAKVNHDKERSRMKVRAEFPNLCQYLEFQNKADLAEAVLICDYFRAHILGLV